MTSPNFRTRWPRLPLLIALATCGSLAACGGDSEPAASRQGGQVVIVEGADLDKPNPIVVATAFDNDINSLLYMSLLAPEWVDGEIAYRTADANPMALAQRYEFFGADSASIRYHLRTDARWTDGRPVTAHDAAFTLRIRGMEEVASPIQDFNREMREIVAEDDSTLVIHFHRRYSEVFYHTGGDGARVIPRHVYEDTDLAQIRSHPSLTNPAEHLITNGPMRIVRWDRGQRVVLERNPYFEPQPNIDRIVFRIIPEETTRMIELQTGNVDMSDVPFHFIDEVRRSPNVRIEKQEKRSYEYIAYNPKANDFFADPEIRRALGLALDREGIISALDLEEFAAVAGGPYAPIFRRLYDPVEQAPLPFDTIEARRILAAKGWSPGPDGVLRKNGQRLGFDLVTNAENRRRVDIAQIAERQWARVGIDANIRTLEFNTLVERMTRRDFDARIGGWNVGLSADLFQIWGDPDGPSNYVSYDNPEVRRLFDLAAGQPNPADAAPFWREAASQIVEDQPYTWLFYYDSPHAVNNRLQGIRIDVLSPYGEVWNWRIEDE